MATKGYKQRQAMNEGLYGAFNQMGAGEVGKQFQGLQGLYGSFFNQMAASQGLQGQAQANSAMANMGRMGLGGTGLGAALGSGLQAGSAFQGNQIRAKMLQELMGQAQNTQSMKANMMFQTGMQQAGTFRGFGDVWREDVMPVVNTAGQIGAGAMMFGGGGGMAGGGMPVPGVDMGGTQPFRGTPFAY